MTQLDKMDPKWLHLQVECLKRDDQMCQRCGRGITAKLVAHYLIPPSLGGTNILDNLITLCGDCDAALRDAGRKTPEMIARAFDQRLQAAVESTDVSWRQWVYGGARRPVGQWWKSA